MQNKNFFLDALCTAVAMANDNHTDNGIDVIMNAFDEAFRNGHFDAVNECLPFVEIEDLGIDLAVVLVMITLAAKDKLPNRTILMDKYEAYIGKHHADEKQGLMMGFR